MKHLPIFVYGTLKTGELRAGKWPHRPERIEPAVARGELYDLGPHPALTDGDDAILGELWQIAPQHFPETIDKLDRIEGFGVGQTDLYVRRIIPVTRLSGELCEAYAYFIANQDTLTGHPRVFPNETGYCTWSRHRGRVSPRNES